MLYVQQSLGPQEEILLGARFHWMYTAQAVMWIILGIAIGIALGYGAIWWDVNSNIRALYADLPTQYYQTAWDQIVQAKGGYLKILWSFNPILRFAILCFFILGLFFFAHMMVVKATTEIAITTERVIYKRGLIARHVGELNIDRVEGVSVNQGAIGRIFGYGVVIIRGMGVGEVTLPPIEAPIEFRRVINEAKSLSERGAVKNPEDFI